MGTPPAACRVSELERPQCNCPALGPFLWPSRVNSKHRPRSQPGRAAAPTAAQKSKGGPGFLPRPDLTDTRGTSARAAIRFYVVTTTAESAFPASSGERLIFPRRKTGARRTLPYQLRI